MIYPTGNSSYAVSGATEKEIKDAVQSFIDYAISHQPVPIEQSIFVIPIKRRNERNNNMH